MCCLFWCCCHIMYARTCMHACICIKCRCKHDIKLKAWPCGSPVCVHWVVIHYTIDYVLGDTLEWWWQEESLVCYEYIYIYMETLTTICFANDHWASNVLSCPKASNSSSRLWHVWLKQPLHWAAGEYVVMFYVGRILLKLFFTFLQHYLISSCHSSAHTEIIAQFENASAHARTSRFR